MEQKKEIEISSGIVFHTILILLALWFLYAILDIIALVFISVIIVAAMDPLVDFLQRKKVPRTASVLGVYLALVLLIALALSVLLPILSNQFDDFSQNLPDYFQSAESNIEKIKDFFQAQHIAIDGDQLGTDLGETIFALPRNIFSKTIGVFSTFISVIVVFSLAFYMTIEKDGIKKFISSISPDKYKDYAVDLTLRIKEKIGKWMLGQLFLMFVVFVLVSLGMFLVGMPYALILGIFAGVMEIIPYVGPIISAVPGIVLGFLISPTLGFLALLVYLVSQQLENHVIVPQVMKKAVGLNPISVILALLIGARLGGAIGAILAIPVATGISLFINDLLEKRKFGA